MNLNSLGNNLENMTWESIVRRIRGCPICQNFVKTSRKVRVHEWDTTMVLPDPCLGGGRLNLLFVSWSPPGGAHALEEHHFFWSEKDGMRRNLFESIRQAGSEISDDQSDWRDCLIKAGVYLIPTVFRRCSKGNKDHRLPQRLATQSMGNHVAQIVKYTIPRVIMFLGDVPLKSAMRCYPNNLAGLKSCYDAKCGRIAGCRLFTKERAVNADLFGIDSSELLVSYWPRLNHLEDLSNDIQKTIRLKC
jgi:uracil-DNA glycosylase